MQIQQEINVLHSFREFNVDDGEVCDYIYELMDGDGVCFSVYRPVSVVCRHAT